MAKLEHKEGVTSLKLLSTRVKELEKLKLFVGWTSAPKYDNGRPVAGIAAVHEYGSASRGIPPRPFLRPTIESHKDEWLETVKNGAKAILKNGVSAQDVINQLGALAVGHIKSGIVNGDHQALSPVTIALRKHRNEGVQIGGAFVGSVASAIAMGQTAVGELGDQSFGNKRPLTETGYMLATITHEAVE